MSDETEGFGPDEHIRKPSQEYQDEHGWKDGKPPPLNGKDHEAEVIDGVVLTWATISEISEIPPREWAYGRFLLFASAACIGAVDGAGKGQIAAVMLVAFITGLPLLGERVWRPGPVAIITYEDNEREWRRRIAAVCIHHGLDYKTVLRGVCFLTRPNDRITLARRAASGLQFPDTNGIVGHLKTIGAVLLLIDPFNSAHGMEDGNNNVAITAVAQEVTTIAERANVAALVLHHLRKGSAGDIDDLMGAVALRANFRAVRILATMTEEEAQQLGIKETFRKSYLRVAATKENYAAPLDRAMWFVRTPMLLGNPAGIYPEDEVPAFKRWEPRPIFADVSYDMLRAVLELLTAKPHSPSVLSREIPWVGKPLVDLAGRNQAQAKTICSLWLKDGVLIEGDPVEGKDRHPRRVLIADKLKVAQVLAGYAAAPETGFDC